MSATLKLVAVPEVARLAGVCPETVRRKLRAANVAPDALMIAGAKQDAPLYLQSRVKNLLAIACQPAIES